MMRLPWPGLVAVPKKKKKKKKNCDLIYSFSMSSKVLYIYSKTCSAYALPSR
jgi:hypothetical protein